MPDDLARLERLLAWRETEEELARRREAAAVRATQSAREKLRTLREQLQACRECGAAGGLGGINLMDAHACAARLRQRAAAQERSLEDARRRLTEAREELAEAGRRRLAVERMATARVVQLREHKDAAAQADLDESGRLRLMLEGDRVC